MIKNFSVSIEPVSLDCTQSYILKQPTNGTWLILQKKKISLVFSGRIQSKTWLPGIHHMNMRGDAGSQQNSQSVFQLHIAITDASVTFYSYLRQLMIFVLNPF